MAPSMDDARSTGTSQSKTQKWKALGMSAASGAGSSISSLVRSAGRKSTESLRSIRSTASRKSSKKSTSNSRPDPPSANDVPPVPVISPYNKDLPPSPFTPADAVKQEAFKQNGGDHAIVQLNGTDSTPKASLDQPIPSASVADGELTPTANGTATPTADGSRTPIAAPPINATRVPVPSSQTAAENPIAETPTRKSTEQPEVKKDSLGSRLRATNLGLRGSASKTSLVDLDEDKVMTDAKTPTRKNSLSRLRKNNGSTSSHTPFAVNSSTSRLSSEQTNINSGTQWASDKSGGGDGNTIAQLYAVFGLPKDPAVWTLAEEDCVAGVHHAEGAVGRFWRPEVLGCSICPTPSEVLSKTQPSADQESGASKWNGRDSGGKKPSNPKFIEMADGRGSVEKAETARVLSKALKLSFTREIEIIAEQGNYPPSATSHTFSFSVPTTSSNETSGGATTFSGKANASSGVGEGFGLENRAKVQGMGNDLDDGPSLATFYGVVLTVWSAADDKRAKTIKRELNRAAKQRGSLTTPKSIKKSPAGTDWTAEGDNSHADEEEDRVGSPSLGNFNQNNTFFMPYAICIVSRYPLYNLLGDWNKMAWHKYSRNIEMHNHLMSTILRHPAPRLGERFSVGSPDKDLSFHCTFPGALEWGTGLIGTDSVMWPLFKTLSLDNILTICEVALAHNGRVLFQSRHPALLGIAVETIRYLVELNGWRGVANQNCHARDVKIYLEDPGSWIIAINTELRSIIKPAKEVCIVDLDINFVNCVRPPLGAISTRQNREKKRRKLLQGASSLAGLEISPPREIYEAYPGGRFRPLSTMVTKDSNSAYEQLATPSWWSQTDVIQTFDRVLRQGGKPTFLKKVLMQRHNKANDISESELNAILGLRRRASTFVDARDGLENKIGRLNKRLAFLMSESDMWRAQFGKIQSLVDRLTKEANDLRSKLDKERRESRRLSSTVAEREMEQVQLRLQLKETETAREEAQAEMLKMQRAMDSLETERESMMEEIRAVISGAGGVEDVNLSLAKMDFPLPSYNPLVRNDSPTGSQASMTPSQAAEYILKSRAMAEARINEGRPGRALSREASSTGHMRSLSQDGGERIRNNPNMSSAQSTTSHVNHFPDDQMNYEIQQRTSVVTSQISKIQAQLENTLTQLEGRRGYDRDERRRVGRRTSNASMMSSRYEYRANSSLGHGGPASSIGHGSEDGRNESFDADSQMEHIKSDGEQRTRRRRDVPTPLGLNGASSQGHGRPNALTPTALSPSALSPLTAAPVFMANGGATRSPTSPSFKNNTLQSQPSLAPKSQARQREVSNPWKEMAVTTADANNKKIPVNNNAEEAAGPKSDEPKTPAYSSEVMVAPPSPIVSSAPPKDIAIDAAPVQVETQSEAKAAEDSIPTVAITAVEESS
jgi:nicotinamide N-methyltransferase